MFWIIQYFYKKKPSKLQAYFKVCNEAILWLIFFCLEIHLKTAIFHSDFSCNVNGSYALQQYPWKSSNVNQISLYHLGDYSRGRRTAQWFHGDLYVCRPHVWSWTFQTVLWSILLQLLHLQSSQTRHWRFWQWKGRITGRRYSDREGKKTWVCVCVWVS